MRRNRWGTVFLITAAVGFVASTFQPWWTGPGLNYVKAFFEASLVGALADWFAVTALFRRPLGLPLPHTDVLVRRKDQLVEALPQFLASFLEPARLHPVLTAVDWAGLLLDKLQPSELDDLLREGLRAMADDPARTRWEKQVLDLSSTLLHRELSLHREALVGPVTDLIKRSAGWKGLFVGRDTVEDGIEGLLGELAALRDNPGHPLRRTLVAAFREALPRLAEQLKPSTWTAETRRRLEQDAKFRAAFNENAGALAVALWERSGVTAALTGALKYLLNQTDARSLAHRIEGAVGNDLQYIRVNGALVGGLAGLVLEALRTTLSSLPPSP